MPALGAGPLHRRRHKLAVKGHEHADLELLRV
jgi:hypothetical protein